MRPGLAKKKQEETRGKSKSKSRSKSESEYKEEKAGSPSLVDFSKTYTSCLTEAWSM